MEVFRQSLWRLFANQLEQFGFKIPEKACLLLTQPRNRKNHFFTRTMSWHHPVCVEIFPKRLKLIGHVLKSHQSDFVVPNLLCGQESCHRSFDNVESWTQHLRKVHEKRIDNLLLTSSSNCATAQSTITIPQLQSDESQPSIEDESLEPAPTIGLDLETVRRVTVTFVSSIRATSSATVSLCEKAVAGCNNVVESTVFALKEMVLSVCAGKMSEEELNELGMQFDSASRPLDFLSSDSKQRAYFTSLQSFVKPVQYVFGAPRYETAYSSSGEPYQKSVMDSWQCVPIAKTLNVALSQPEIMEQVMASFNSKRCDWIVEEFVDGLLFRELNPFFANNIKRTLALDLYYDDIEVCNALGSKATIHKIGVFYFVIRNLPSYYNSAMANIQWAALAYTNDLKKYGYNAILDKIAEDLRDLESEGINIELGTGTLDFVGGRPQVSGDNLGRHALFGMFESFSATQFCDTCMAQLPDIQDKHYESEFHLREQESFDKQVEVCNAMDDYPNLLLYCKVSRIAPWGKRKISDRFGGLCARWGYARIKFFFGYFWTMSNM
ncbi:MAG: hypothetical protein GY696_24540 [Gammaproteobacteria bacterium]|nr:hypothetical protein [Gammaproteobacteria bacterium]